MSTPDKKRILSEPNKTIHFGPCSGTPLNRRDIAKGKLVLLSTLTSSDAHHRLLPAEGIPLAEIAQCQILTRPISLYQSARAVWLIGLCEAVSSGSSASRWVVILGKLFIGQLVLGL